MITLAQYFRQKPHTIEQFNNAIVLLRQINKCHALAAADGCYGYWIDPDTGTQISGCKGGTGGGGFRVPNEAGSLHSAHKDGMGEDTFDPDRIFAKWCLMHQDVLEALGLYMEDPRWTNGWVHLQTRRPGSGSTVFIPYADIVKNPPNGAPLI
ncbi:MAG: hypothetical protein PHP57_13395 [Sideroxydans sp.]|nr:hypothetical protein [Sideroxydans sp.]